MFNKVILVGNLTRDVELRYLPNGSALAKIGLATNRKYKRQDGTQADETCFIDVNLFGRTAEVANQYLKKGSQILIEGRLILESWTDSTGQKRNRHTVTAESMQMLGGRASTGDGYNNSQVENYNDGYAGGSYSNNVNSPQKQQTKESEIPVIDINDEEIPF